MEPSRSHTEDIMAPVELKRYQVPSTLCQPVTMAPELLRKYQAPPSISQPVRMTPKESR